MNDLYSAGLDDDKFALLYNVNRNVNIAVKTPVGKTERQNIKNVITQGDVFSQIFCSKQVDTFGQECLVDSKCTKMYRGEVEIPPLSMVDDVLCVSECGFKTSMVHGYMKMKTDSKKLQFGAEKCKKLHIGKMKEEFKCQTLKVDNWKEIEIRNEETGISEIEDIVEGEEEMEVKMEEKYLGDVISTDGRNIKNVKARVAKGIGIVSKILSILEGIPFGQFYFEVAVILRDSLLVSSMLSNSEAWYNVTNAELELLETVDVKFLRGIFKAPKATPKEMLYLESGCVPFRELIKKRRISFLHYILNEKPDSMINRFLNTQMKSQKPKDWTTQVQKDMKEWKIEMTFEELKGIKKSKLKRILHKAVEEKTLERLNEIKRKHSKVMGLNHTKLKMQNYLKANKLKISQELAQTVFKMRSRMEEVKINFRGKYENLECGVCKEVEESQKHIIECREILKMKENDGKTPDYENLFGENVKKQVEIAKTFTENLKIKNRLELKT